MRSRSATPQPRSGVDPRLEFGGGEAWSTARTRMGAPI